MFAENTYSVTNVFLQEKRQIYSFYNKDVLNHLLDINLASNGTR